jgi:hypothetical protein
MVVIYYRGFGTTFRSNLTGSMKKEPISFPTKSVRNYPNTLLHIPEERKCQLFRDGSLIFSFLLKITRLILLPQTLYQILYNIKNSVRPIFTFYDIRYSFFLIFIVVPCILITSKFLFTKKCTFFLNI